MLFHAKENPGQPNPHPVEDDVSRKVPNDKMIDCCRAICANIKVDTCTLYDDAPAVDPIHAVNTCQKKKRAYCCLLCKGRTTKETRRGATRKQQCDVCCWNKSASNSKLELIRSIKRSGDVGEKRLILSRIRLRIQYARPARGICGVE